MGYVTNSLKMSMLPCFCNKKKSLAKDDTVGSGWMTFGRRDIYLRRYNVDTHLFGMVHCSMSLYVKQWGKGETI